MTCCEIAKLFRLYENKILYSKDDSGFRMHLLYHNGKFYLSKSVVIKSSSKQRVYWEIDSDEYYDNLRKVIGR